MDNCCRQFASVDHTQDWAKLAQELITSGLQICSAGDLVKGRANDMKKRYEQAGKDAKKLCNGINTVKDSTLATIRETVEEAEASWDETLINAVESLLTKLMTKCEEKIKKYEEAFCETLSPADAEPFCFELPSENKSTIRQTCKNYERNVDKICSNAKEKVNQHKNKIQLSVKSDVTEMTNWAIKLALFELGVAALSLVSALMDFNTTGKIIEEDQDDVVKSSNDIGEFQNKLRGLLRASMDNNVSPPAINRLGLLIIEANSHERRARELFAKYSDRRNAAASRRWGSGLAAVATFTKTYFLQRQIETLTSITKPSTWVRNLSFLTGVAQTGTALLSHLEVEKLDVAMREVGRLLKQSAEHIAIIEDLSKLLASKS